MLIDTARFRCPANVAARVLDGEAIMIHLESGRYYSSDALGAVVWHLLDSGVAFGAIVATVVEHFAVPPERARGDIDGFVSELIREQLLVGEAAAGSVDPAVALELGDTYTAPSLRAYRDMADLLALDPPMPSLKPVR